MACDALYYTTSWYDHLQPTPWLKSAPFPPKVVPFPKRPRPLRKARLTFVKDAGFQLLRLPGSDPSCRKTLHRIN